MYKLKKGTFIIFFHSKLFLGFTLIRNTRPKCLKCMAVWHQQQLYSDKNKILKLYELMWQSASSFHDYTLFSGFQLIDFFKKIWYDRQWETPSSELLFFCFKVLSSDNLSGSVSIKRWLMIAHFTPSILQ